MTLQNNRQPDLMSQSSKSRSLSDAIFTKTILKDNNDIIFNSLEKMEDKATISES